MVSYNFCDGLFSVGEDVSRTRWIGQPSQAIQKISRSSKAFLTISSSSMYQERRIPRRTVSHEVQGSNRLLPFIWTQSYQFGLQSLHESFKLMTKKNYGSIVCSFYRITLIQLCLLQNAELCFLTQDHILPFFSFLVDSMSPIFF